MKTITKALAGTVAAGAMAMTSAAPAFARDRGHDKIDAGEVIAGAVILGGIAAILSSGKKDRYRDRHYDNRYDGRHNSRYDNRRGNGERAIERCIRTAERDARRYGYRSANVTQIRDVDRTRDGWRVKGRITVATSRGYAHNGYNNRGYNNRYDRGNRYNHRGYSQDSGKFTCDISRGQGAYVDFKGIRGLR